MQKNGIVIFGGVEMTRTARTAFQKQFDGYPLAQHEQQALARHSDPQTSHEAAAKTLAFRARHAAKIWAALVDYGPMTAREIAERTGLDYHAVQRRGADMGRNDLVRIGPDVRDGCRVWVAIVAISRG